jgi:hypothetical protein
VAVPRDPGPFLTSGERFKFLTAGGWTAFGRFSFEIETDVLWGSGGPNLPYIRRVRVSTSLATGPTSFSVYEYAGGTRYLPGAGTWSCSTSAVEMEDEYAFAHPVGPEWVGESQHGARPELRVYYVATNGTPFEASLSIGGLEVSISGVCAASSSLLTFMPGSGFGFLGFIGIKPLMIGDGQGTLPPESANCSLTATVLGQSIGVPHAEHLPRGSYPTGSRPFGIPNAMDLDFNGGVAVTLTADASNNAFSFSHEGGRLDVQAPTDYLIRGGIRAMAHPHEEEFEGQAHGNVQTWVDGLSFNPSIGQTCRRVQEVAEYRAGFGTVSDFENLYDEDTGLGCSANLLRDSCTAALESRCTKLLARGRVTPGVYLRHNARHVLDDCASAEGWAGVTEGGGHLVADSDLISKPMRTFAAGEAITRAYRYLVVDLVAPVEGASISARIESPYGIFTLNGRAGPAGVAAPVVFDLCALNLPGPVDMRYGRWPPNSESATAFASGIDAINWLEIQLPPDSGVYEIHEVRLERFTPPRITFLNAEEGVLLTGDVEDGQVFPYVLGDVDGRRTLEFFGLYVDGDGSLNYRNLGDFKYYAESQYPGWEVDVIEDETLPLVGLGGAGAIPVGDTVDAWIRREWDEGEPIPYQRFYAGLRVPPNSGDIFGGGSFGGPAHYRVEKILGGGVNGLVLSPGRLPVEDVTVKLERLPGLEPEGTGVTDTLGRYGTGAPWGRSAVSHRLTAMRGKPPTWPTHDMATPLRTDRRVSFIGARLLGRSIAYDVSDSQRHLRAYFDGKRLVVGRTGNDLPEWDDTYSAVDGEAVAIAIDKRSRAQELLLLVATETDLRLYTSKSEGRSLTLATTIATGSFKSPAIAISRPGFRCLYWLAGTVLKGQIRDAANNIVRATFDAITGVDEDGGAAVGESVVHGGQLRMVLIVTVDGALVQYTSADGVAWS